MDSEKFLFYSGMPLVTKGRIRGVLEVFHRSPRVLDETWLRLLDALSAQTAIAVENASMFQDLQRSNADLGLAYEATIEGWSRALDCATRRPKGTRCASRTRLSNWRGHWAYARMSWVTSAGGPCSTTLGRLGFRTVFC
jgi:hypothetical protein